MKIKTELGKAEDHMIACTRSQHNEIHRRTGGLMKDSIILLVKECIAAHACIQTENGNVIGLFLDDIAVDRIADDVADALIANGIGDVAEWKRRAEVAEQKYKIALEKVCHKFQKYSKNYQTALKRFDDEITRQAEREIEEERK